LVMLEALGCSMKPTRFSGDTTCSSRAAGKHM
jgi:hypothetical protein